MRSPPDLTAGSPRALHGHLDIATRTRVAGWAHDPADPDAPVALIVAVDDALHLRVLADTPRDDLRVAGLGDGRHGFDIALSGLSPFARHVFEIRRESDGAHVPGSPAALDPAARFDDAVQAEIASLLADPPDADELRARIGFLAAQTETLLQRLADARSHRAERIARQQIKWRWQGDPKPAPAAPHRRALFVDDRVPDPNRDAGSNAILSHMVSMRRLGFGVTFAATNMAPDDGGVLEHAGIECCERPWHGSVEEVLRREADCFDVVYLHRYSVAARYVGLVRHYQRKARLVFSVADLHCVRLARQAEVEDRPELRIAAKRAEATELWTAAQSDAVVTHSDWEAAWLRARLPKVRVHVVRWDVPVRRTVVPFADRSGVAFIGHFGHPPNVDAARWLIGDIMPRVWAIDPAIRCLLVGSDMPASLRDTSVAGIDVVGQVADLSQIFDTVRLTVAPLAFGAGIKGKVLASLAAGVPCVCTPVAAEGLGDLPAALRDLVSASDDGLAERIARVHSDTAVNTACADAGVAFVARTLTGQQVDAELRAATDSPGAG